MSGKQNVFKGALGWDDWIWWSAIGAVGLFLLMLMLCCCICVKRAKRKGRSEALAQANARRREREQQQRAELQYAQARQQQAAARDSGTASFKYSKPEPPVQAMTYQTSPQNGNRYGQQQQQQPPYGGAPQQPYGGAPQQSQYRDPMQRQQQQYAAPTQSPYQQQQPYRAQPYQEPYQSAPMQQQYQAPPPPQQKFYPPPASPPKFYPPPASPPPIRQMYEGVPTPAERYSQGTPALQQQQQQLLQSEPLESEFPVAAPTHRYHTRKMSHPDQPPLLQYGRKNSKATTQPQLTASALSTLDTFQSPDGDDDVPFVHITSPSGIPLGGGFNSNAPRESFPSGTFPRESTTSKSSSVSSRMPRGPTLQDRIEALRSGGVQDNHTRISVEDEESTAPIPVASTATSSTDAPSPLRSQEDDKQTLFRRQLAATANIDDDSFVSSDSSPFGDSFVSADSGDSSRAGGILTPREQDPYQDPLPRELDRRESVEF